MERLAACRRMNGGFPEDGSPGWRSISRNATAARMEALMLQYTGGYGGSVFLRT